MHIKPDALRVFITVAECGSLADAAGLLNRTPSAISMTLKRFAGQLGAELFETDRKSTLTHLGQLVLDEGRRALNDFDESMRTVQQHAEGKMGAVRLATVPSVAMRLLPGALQSFQAVAPDVRLEVRDLDSSLVADAVRSGKVDFGIASLTLASHDLESEFLLEESFGLVCRKDHEIAREDIPLKWEALKNTRLIGNGLDALIREPEFARLSAAATIHVHNTTTLLAFIRQGLGVTLLPKMAVPDDVDFYFLPLADSSVLRQLYFLQHRQHRLSPAAQEFKRHIVAGV